MAWKRLALALLIALSACAEEGSSAAGRSGPACPDSLDELAAQVFQPSCVDSGCHGAVDRAGGLNLEARALEFELFGREAALCGGATRLVAGDASASHLIAKLRGTTDCGAQMPVETQLAEETIDCVAAWVDQLDLSTVCETCGGDRCIDVQIDAQNCGVCGNVCGGTAICLLGTCACPGGRAACESGCVDLDSDPANCGGCSNDCGDAFCLNGQCSADCGALTECSGVCVDPSGDPSHCGACDNTCGPGSTCVDGECQCAGTTVSFADDVQPVFTAGCASQGCHDGGRGRPGGPGGGGSRLDLRPGSSYDSLLEETTSCGPVLAPGEPENSVLIGKLTGEEVCSGSQMPKGDEPLPQEIIETIAVWICQGAENN